MKKTGIIYGSSTGTCQVLAEKIAEKLGVDSADVLNVQDVTADTLASFEALLLGTSTWGAGEMQDDWYDGVKVLAQAGLQGKTVAVFGCGDCEGYSDTFCGGMAELYRAAEAAGAQMVGQVSTEGYTFDDSEAVDGDHFLGLALDDLNEEDKSDDRIAAWAEALQSALA